MRTRAGTIPHLNIGRHGTEPQSGRSGSRRPSADAIARPFSTVIRFICGLTCAFLAMVAIVWWPHDVMAQTKLADSAVRSQTDRAIDISSVESLLASRGLLSSGFAGRTSTIEPPTGTEVDETVQTAKQDGKTISRMRSWTEELNNSALHIEVTSFPTRQSQVAFWVLPDKSPGCSIFGRTMYDTNHRALQSEFWRNDSQLKITGSADFPSDLYPEALPALALLRAIDFTRPGSSGRIDQQISPYGFVDQQVTVKESNPLQVPAGRFAAVRVDSQPNASSILPTWPRFMLGVVTPFLPQSTYYFQAAPPHRLLRKEQAGTPFIGGPEAVTELVRYYIAGATASN